MSSPIYQRILVPLDGSETSQLGLQEAIRVAKLTQGELRLFHVVDDLSFALAMDAYAGQTGDWLRALREMGSKLLEDGRRVAQEAGVKVQVALHEKFNDGLPDAVAAEARRWPADLIVLGTHGRRGVGRFMLGTSAEQILRTARVPVLLVRAAEERLRALGATIHHGGMVAHREGADSGGLFFEDPDGIRLEVNYIPGKGLLASDPPLNPSSDPDWDQNAGPPRF